MSQIAVRLASLPLPSLSNLGLPFVRVARAPVHETVHGNGDVRFVAGYAVAQWLRHCSTNRKVAGSIPDCVTGFFH
jgi:hypothetical protein